MSEKNKQKKPAFRWLSSLQELPEDGSYLLFCFGVNICEGSYYKNLWLSHAYGDATPDFWAYFPPPPHHKRNTDLYLSDSA